MGQQMPISRLALNVSCPTEAEIERCRLTV